MDRARAGKDGGAIRKRPWELELEGCLGSTHVRRRYGVQVSACHSATEIRVHGYGQPQALWQR